MDELAILKSRQTMCTVYTAALCHQRHCCMSRSMREGVTDESHCSADNIGLGQDIAEIVSKHCAEFVTVSVQGATTAEQTNLDSVGTSFRACRVGTIVSPMNTRLGRSVA